MAGLDAAFAAARHAALRATDSPLAPALLLCAVLLPALLCRAAARAARRPVAASRAHAPVRGAFTLLCAYAIVLEYRAPHVWGWAGVAGAFAFKVQLMVLDFIVSDTAWRNLATMTTNGFSGTYIALCAAFVQSMSSSNGVFVWLMYPDLQPAGPLWLLAGGVALNLAVGELAFTAGHKYLHENWPSLHHMHHCCLTPSFMTNFHFAPGDILVEFSGPVTGVLLTHFVLFQQPWLFLLSLLAVHVWYAMDHDENLRLPHTRHHNVIDSVFTIYIERKDRSVRDGVRALVRRAPRAAPPAAPRPGAVAAGAQAP